MAVPALLLAVLTACQPAASAPEQSPQPAATTQEAVPYVAPTTSAPAPAPTTPAAPTSKAPEAKVAPPANAPAPPKPVTCGEGYYLNSDGKCVQRPVQAPQPPAGASAECNDGTYSFSAHRRGTCSSHGGVKRWLKDLPA
ncbi:DUF3761 domain-containing protein [Longispora fulva]|uniref:DUF3761 domain-containing protein n=1 Tax=Longispora fulva TaxID=619741 RepID=A0A8J7GUH2_9ACTN|nr:DUF3761 domain-containing protein [Longispora fulva]MBG6139745.1 hypothetical protein [Longispora fulva]